MIYVFSHFQRHRIRGIPGLGKYLPRNILDNWLHYTEITGAVKTRYGIYPAATSDFPWRASTTVNHFSQSVAVSVIETEQRPRSKYHFLS